MHRHGCFVIGHHYDCAEDCECICGLPMEGYDHSECPIELRACPEHAEPNGLTAEAESDAVEIDFSVLSQVRQQSRPHCECGCAETDPREVVGWCLHCDHTYTDYSPEIENRHFAQHCPGAPEQSRQAARASFVRH